MLRSLLLAVDDTPGALAARAVAIALARRSGAQLTAAAVLDRPHTTGAREAMPLGGAAFAEHRNAALAARLDAEAAAALAAAQQAAGDLAIATVTLVEAPEPALLRESVGHDLVVIGRDCTLGLEQPEDGLAPVIPGLLRDGARPLLVVPAPAGPEQGGPEQGGPEQGVVLVGYDASLPAIRALQSFALLGLAEGSPVKLLAVDPEIAEARRLAAEGAGYLRRHGLEVEEWPAARGRPAELLLAEAVRLPARLLVIGAFGTARLQALFHGSATQRLLRDAPCPIFIQH